MNRPKNNKIRRPQFLCIVGCEGKNQERIYFDKVAELVNCVEERTHDLVFDYAEPYGGNPKCVVERTIQKSIGKENKVSVFDYDGKKDKYEEAIDLAIENKIELGYTNYCFDLWLILHKEGSATEFPAYRGHATGPRRSPPPRWQPQRRYRQGKHSGWHRTPCRRARCWGPCRPCPR